MSSINKFTIYDYSIFSFILLFSALIGFYYAWTDRNKKTTNNFLLGDRKLKIIPVGMSILASFTSAVSILGFSQEMYRFGGEYLIMGLSYFLSQSIATYIFVPFYHNLKLTSAYEYLEMRFNSKVRIISAIIFCIQMLFYMAIALYTPSLAIQQVMGISLWISIVLTGIICTIYTSLGGMKAVVWTDTFQVLVMYIGLLSIIIQGSLKVGGFKVIIERAYKTDRLELFNFDLNPFQRHTFWNLMIGGCFTSLTVYGSNQATIQRYLTLPTINDAKKAMFINFFGTFSILLLSCLSGFIAFAYYFNCDPKLDGKISKYDQILPYLVMDLLRELPGLAGLFIACIYSAALSTISSGLNSLAAVCLKDFIQPIYTSKYNSPLSEQKATKISKILAAIFGLITIGLSYSCEYLGSTVLQISLSIFGLLGGPLLGVISLGMFVPFARPLGATVGLLTSLLVNLWIGVGSVLYGKMPPSKSFNQNCTLNDFNSTQSNIFWNVTASMHLQAPTKSLSTQAVSIYNLSYLWFSFLAVFIVLTLGSTISLFETKVLNTKVANRQNDQEDLNFNIKEKFIKSCIKSSSSSNSYSFNSKNKQEINEMDNFISK